MASPTAKAISQSGNVTLEEGVVFRPTTGTSATVKSITFTNTNDATDYELWVYRRFENGGTATLLYRFILDAGDRVEDNTLRCLTDQHEIVAKASVDTIVFSIEGTEEPTT